MVVLLGIFLFHPNIFSENMVLVKIEKLRGGGNRKKCIYPLGTCLLTLD